MKATIKMNVSVTRMEEIQVTKREIGLAIMQEVVERTGIRDDAGCDWMTEGEDIYIGGREWKVVSSKEIASLVNAANLLMYGNIIPVRDTEKGLPNGG